MTCVDSGANPFLYVDTLGLAYYPEWSFFNGDVKLIGNAEVGAWIADLPGNNVREGCGTPPEADIDFIFVNGIWYKIKGGTAKVSPDGKVSGIATYPIHDPSWTWDGGTPEYIDYIKSRLGGSLDPTAIGCGCDPGP